MRYNHFSPSEFSCRCSCNSGNINPLLVALLDKIRAQIEMPIKVTSGIRCHSYNERVGGHVRSRHMPDAQGIAHAADISCDDLEKLHRFCQDNFMAVGDGRSKGFIHVDMRPDKVRRWLY